MSSPSSHLNKFIHINYINWLKDRNWFFLLHSQFVGVRSQKTRRTIFPTEKKYPSYGSVSNITNNFSYMKWYNTVDGRLSSEQHFSLFSQHNFSIGQRVLVGAVSRAASFSPTERNTHATIYNTLPECACTWCAYADPGSQPDSYGLVVRAGLGGNRVARCCVAGWNGITPPRYTTTENAFGQCNANKVELNATLFHLHAIGANGASFRVYLHVSHTNTQTCGQVYVCARLAYSGRLAQHISVQCIMSHFLLYVCMLTNGPI